MKATTVRIKGELKEVEKYEILKPLGEGGIGIVYLARHKELENYVAIKELLETTKLYFDHLLQLFEQEAKLCAKLSVHPNIIKVMDILHDEEKKIYIVMEYISREGYDEHGFPLPAYTLEDLIRKGMSEHTAIEIFKKICDGVVYAHKMHVVHRDLKPTNILIGQYNQIKVCDFGIAKVLKEGAKKSKMSFRVGTYAYMAPEQIEESTVGYFSDIYSLSIIFYEMLTGKYPYEIKRGTDTEYMDAHRTAQPRLEYITNPRLREIVKKGLEKNYELRYQTIDELIKDIDRAVEITPKIVVEKVKVPSLLGKPKDEGIKLLESLGLKYKVMYSEGKKDYIIAQDITDGKEVDKGTEIMIFVGKGKEEGKTRMIDVTLLPKDKAIKILESKGFSVELNEEYSNSIHEGYVIAQEPKPEEIVETGAKIKLIISKGKKELKPIKKKAVIWPFFLLLIPIIIGVIMYFKYKPHPPVVPAVTVENTIELNKCPNCGQLYDISSNCCSFCISGGKSVNLIRVRLPKGSVKRCPNCGLYFDASADFCPYCEEEGRPVKLVEVK